MANTGPRGASATYGPQKGADPSTVAALDAVLGRDDFKDFGAIPLRTLAVLYSSYTHLVTLADYPALADHSARAEARPEFQAICQPFIPPA